MSYLHLPRLVFSGDFISDVSTVNNDPAHYNNATFQPSFQEYGQGSKNGWWNPEGGATFNFQDCKVCKVRYADGSSSDRDELIGVFVEGPEGRSAGKMVDLDPQQQGVSELWAVKLRILTRDNALLLEGDIGVTPFRDLQLRQHGGADINGQPLGASWTSVIRNITWGEKADDHRLFSELKNETQDNKLAVNLNGFGYYYSHAADGRFSLGRILGAIGPWYRDEPNTFTAERRLFATKQYGSSNNPSTFFNISNFRFDADRSRLSLDLGNSFPVVNSLGDIAIQLSLVLGIAKKPFTNVPSIMDVTLTPDQIIETGTISYTQGDWLMKTGGIIDLEDVSNELQHKQLLLLSKMSDGNYTLIARESMNGLNVRADEMVLRLDTHYQSEVRFFARQWGKPLATGQVGVQMANPTKTTPSPICPIPGNNFPQDGLTLSNSTIQIKDGIGRFTITGNKINNPRGYIEGQMYFIGYGLLQEPADPADSAGDAISVHLRDYFPVPDYPKWSDIRETMQQFSNLYPIMSKYIVDLGNREAVLAKKDIVHFAFDQDINSPIYMPVTRDLSEGKRQTILRWLESNGEYDTDEMEITSLRTPVSESLERAEPANTDGVSDFHQKLIQAMRLKMGKDIRYSPIDYTNF